MTDVTPNRRTNYVKRVRGRPLRSLTPPDSNRRSHLYAALFSFDGGTSATVGAILARPALVLL